MENYILILVLVAEFPLWKLFKVCLVPSSQVTCWEMYFQSLIVSQFQRVCSDACDCVCLSKVHVFATTFFVVQLYGFDVVRVIICVIVLMQTTEMANSDLDKYYKALDGFVFCQKYVVALVLVQLVNISCKLYFYGNLCLRNLQILQSLFCCISIS